MRFATEKRRLLGWLALLAPLPLPLNEPRPAGVISWPFLGLWILVMVVFLRRAGRGETTWLSAKWLNILGLLYLPILVFDVVTSGASLLVRPMMHLALFALGAKLFSLERERDKWQALLGIFFVFITSMATSTSFAIVLYLLVFLPMVARAMSHLAALHMASFETPWESRNVASRSAARGRWMLPAAALVMVPVFWLLPRFSDPFFMGQGGRGLDIGTGFSDQVRLDGIGRIRGNVEVAMRLGFLDQQTTQWLGGLRLRGATYDIYAGDHWEQTEGRMRLRPRSGQALVFDPAPAVSSAEVWLEPLGSRALIVPNTTVRMISDFGGALETNDAGALRFLIPPTETVNYRVDLGAQPPQWATAPQTEDDPTLDQSGVSARIAELAQRIAGEGSGGERARRLETHLQSEYQYDLELLGSGGNGAIETFLFEKRAGHCEYFASALVLMLRSQGIPARFVTGFLGAENSPLGYAIVRQGNAHAWVEAYVPEEGWVVFDPTPPSGRPGVGSGSALELARQAYDWLVFSWDRYVLAFGSGQQQRLFADLWRRLRATFASVKGDVGEDAAGVGPIGSPQVAMTSEDESHVELLVVLALLPLVTLLGGIWWWLRSRRSLDLMRSYLRLRRSAARHGLEVTAAPLEFVEQCRVRFPRAANSVDLAVSTYLRDSFSDQRSDRLERRRATQAVKLAEQGFALHSAEHRATEKATEKRSKEDRGSHSEGTRRKAG